MTRLSAFLPVLTFAAAVGSIGSRADARSLYIFEPLAGYVSTVVSGLSDDGTRVTGYYATSFHSQSAFWGTTSGIADHFGSGAASTGNDISGDGQIVVGATRRFDGGAYRAYRYHTATGQYENLGLFPRMLITDAARPAGTGRWWWAWGTTATAYPSRSAGARGWGTPP